jgi:hypothetical protein
MHLGDIPLRRDAATNQHFYQPFHNGFRSGQTYAIGKTRTGKSTFLTRCAIDDMRNRRGIAFFDPHGDAVGTLLLHVPEARWCDVILIDPSDYDFPVSLNPFYNIPKHRRSDAATLFTEMFKTLAGYEKFPTPEMDQYLYQSIAALLDHPNGTLVGLTRFLTRFKFRKRVLGHVENNAIKEFWNVDFAKLDRREQINATRSTVNKVRPFYTDPTLRNIFGQPKNAIDFKDIMDCNKILIVSYPLGQLGTTKAATIASIILAQLHFAALDRLDPNCSVKRPRTPFYVYADECQYPSAAIFREMLSGDSKTGLSLVLANQYLDGLDDVLRKAIIGTVATLVAFRVGVSDAEVLEKEMGIHPVHKKLYELEPYTAHARSVSGSQFLHMPEITHKPNPNAPAAIREMCRKRYARPRAEVEEEIDRIIPAT